MAKKNAALWAGRISEHMGVQVPCIMFVDGTEIKICRPSIWQRLCFNGHKRFHSTGWQGLMAPNGIIIQLYGPCLGTYHDSKMIGLSRLIDVMKHEFPRYFVYADQGYGLSEQIQHGFSRLTATAEEQHYNFIWSKERICVEWGFGQVKEIFKTVNDWRSAKPLEACVGIWYMAAVLLRNCIVCMRGQDEVSGHFVLRPPTLDDYLLPDGPEFQYWMDKYPPVEDVFDFAFTEAEVMGIGEVQEKIDDVDSDGKGDGMQTEMDMCDGDEN